MELLIDNWRYGLALVMALVASIVTTQTPEVRKYRWWFFLTLAGLIAFVWVTIHANSIVGIVLLFVLLRPVLWMVGLMSYAVMGHHLAEGMNSTLYGSSGPPDKQLDIVLVTRARTSGDFSGAVKHLKEVVHSRPDNFEARLLLAAIHVEDLGDLRSAEAQVKEILAAPTIIPGWKQLAEDRLRVWKIGGHRSASKAPALQSLLSDREKVRVETAPGELHPLELPPDKAKPVLHCDPTVTSLSTVEDLARAGCYGLAMEMVDDIVTKHPLDYCAHAQRAMLCLRHLHQLSIAKSSLDRLLNAPEMNAEECEAVFALADWCATDRELMRQAKRLVRHLMEEAKVPDDKRLAATERMKRLDNA